MATAIDRMYKHFGKDYTHTCGECSNLIRYTQSRSWFKCLRYGDTRCDSSDWCLKRIACGAFNIPQPPNHRCIVELYRGGSKAKANDPVEGQLAFGQGADNMSKEN